LIQERNRFVANRTITLLSLLQLLLKAWLTTPRSWAEQRQERKAEDVLAIVKEDWDSQFGMANNEHGAAARTIELH
jgi:hypothetical protein